MSEDFIKVPKFNGQNFQGWKRQMTVVLENKGLLDCLEAKEVLVGTESKEKPKTNDDARKRETTAQALLFQSMTPAIVEEVLSCTTAAEIWNRLCLVYENSSEINIDRLLNEFHTYKKTQNMTMAQHISKVSYLALQLKQLGEEQSDR